MSDMEPLQRLIANHVDDEMVSALAAEFARGRSLLVATTNLDAGRPVIWNITRIAASGSPKSRELIRSLLLASASIPGAFPPVYIEVEANGERYDEMHVDGSASSQVFLYPAALDFRQLVESVGFEGKQNVYVLRNSFLRPKWHAVEPKLLSIVGQSIEALIKTQGIGDFYRIYLGSLRDGLDFHLANIPEEFDEVSTEAFDIQYMQKLFDLGYERAKSGYPWKTSPPGMDPPALPGDPSS